MKDYMDSRAAAWDEYAKEFNCDHTGAPQVLRKRVIRNGSFQHVRQCQRCGEATCSPIAVAKAEAEYGGPVPPFEESLLTEWNDKRKAAAAEIDKRFDRAAFMGDYDKYLQSAEWKARRRRVVERAGNLCEGCRCASVDEVHHLSYAHVGNEFLFELVALCHPCHERLHAESE